MYDDDGFDLSIFLGSINFLTLLGDLGDKRFVPLLTGLNVFLPILIVAMSLSMRTLIKYRGEFAVGSLVYMVGYITLISYLKKRGESKSSPAH